MKSWKEYWPKCKFCVRVLLFSIAVWLILLPLSISPAGIRLGRAVLPVRLSGNLIQAVYSSIFGALLPLLTWVSLILYAGVRKRPLLRLFSFQAGLLVVMLMPLAIKLRQMPSFHMFLVVFVFLFTLDGILKLFSWLFKDSRTAASTALACVQVAGPLIMYINDFRDFFPPSLARMASIAYLEFPFYQKATGLLKEGGLSPLVPDLILAAVVLLLAAGLYLKNRKVSSSAS
ncbi:MAG: hypothetical protein GXO69_08515 [Acidobacteria bacterium]|nr:hypothetical protein [Acidobacteriota bacterium]